MFKINIKELVYKVRKLNEDKIRGLVADIRANGQRVPILVEGRINVVDGVHRVVALGQLGIEEVLCEEAGSITTHVILDVMGFASAWDRKAGLVVASGTWKEMISKYHKEVGFTFFISVGGTALPVPEIGLLWESIK